MGGGKDRGRKEERKWGVKWRGIDGRRRGEGMKVGTREGGIEGGRWRKVQISEGGRR